MYFCTKFGKITLTFRMVVSMSFESFIINCCRLSTFEIIMFGHSVHRITTKNHDIMVGPIYSKAVTVTFDLDLDSQKKNWQEPFLEPTHETKHDGISQLRYLKIFKVELKQLKNMHFLKNVKYSQFVLCFFNKSLLLWLLVLLDAPSDYNKKSM